jgi:hypothetical protein
MRAARSVHCTTAGEPEQTGGQRGPRFTSTGPVQEPSPPRLIGFPVWARRARARRYRADPLEFTREFRMNPRLH